MGGCFPRNDLKLKKLNIMVFQFTWLYCSKTRFFFTKKKNWLSVVSEIMLAACACHFQSKLARSFYKITLSEIDLKDDHA